MPRSLSIPEQLSFSTVRLECALPGGASSVGTGFIYKIEPKNQAPLIAIVTNRHVVEGASACHFYVTNAAGDGMPAIGHYTRVEYPDFQRLLIPHPDPDVDLCALPLSPPLSHAEQQGFRSYYTTLDRSFVPIGDALSRIPALSEVVMVGYPIGLWDSANNMPIFREGIAATHPFLDYEGRREFIIDLACFPGSSGSPVLCYRRGVSVGVGLKGGPEVSLLGILWGGPQYTVEGELKPVAIPTNLDAIPVSQVPMNLGCVIRAERLFEFDSAALPAVAGSGT